MKTKFTTTGRLAGLAFAAALLTVAATAATAQEKGAAKLLQLGTSEARPITVASEYKLMTCAACKDSLVTIPDREIKGAGAKTLLMGGQTKVVAKHLCGSCANEWVVKGHGKAKISVPIHKCGSCG